MADAELQVQDAEDLANEDGDWDEDDDYNEDDGDDDIDAEAEEMARRLEEQLWEDIRNANAASVAPQNPHEPAEPSESPAVLPVLNAISKKHEAVILTMKSILSLLQRDALARSTLASTVIPGLNGENILDILNISSTSGTVTKEVVLPLSHITVLLAHSETLFGKLRHSDASAVQLDRGKRKREQNDDDLGFQRRPYVPSYLSLQMNEAVRVVSHALGAPPTLGHPLDPSLIASIQLPLHQIFLFAVTSSSRGGPEMNALQEIGGLIQVLGVLSGIQIGPTPHSHPMHPQHPLAIPPNPMTDIGTAVYPCLVTGCPKVFSRLYGLRAHQRVHADHRPFRCDSCPASFARNHDLKRHSALHAKKAWKCGGCNKVFSRRDAIKRHKNGSKNRGPKAEACIEGAVLEVEVDNEEGEDGGKGERRAKLWNGIASGTSSAPATAIALIDNAIEEGEIDPMVVSELQMTVRGLHGTFQAHVANALGAPPALSSSGMAQSNGQATLASVIARAQSQNAASDALASIAAASSPPPSSEQVPALQNETREPPTTATTSQDIESAPLSSLSLYGLSDEQTKLLELAIANAASAAQAQAEAEAAMEEEEDVFDQDDEEDDSDGEPDTDTGPIHQ